MDIQKVKPYITLSRFFKDYCDIEMKGHIKHKVRGRDSAGNVIDFTPAEKKKIRKGFNKLVSDMKIFLK